MTCEVCCSHQTSSIDTIHLAWISWTYCPACPDHLFSVFAILSIKFQICSSAESDEYAPVLLDFEVVRYRSLCRAPTLYRCPRGTHTPDSSVAPGKEHIVTHVVHLRHSHQSSVRIRHSRTHASKRPIFEFDLHLDSTEIRHKLDRRWPVALCFAWCLEHLLEFRHRLREHCHCCT